MNNLSSKIDEDVVLAFLATPKHRCLRPDYNVGITSRENGKPSKLAKTKITKCFENKASHFFFLSCIQFIPFIINDKLLIE